MSIDLVIQYVVVALIVIVCALTAFRKLLPNLSNRWLACASIHFGRKRDSRVAQSLSRHLQPKQATSHSCADGCATCNACGPKRPAAARPPEAGVGPLRFASGRAPAGSDTRKDAADPGRPESVEG